MADFTGNQIRHTYQRLLQIDDRFGNIFTVQDGTGSMDLTGFGVSGSLNLTGSQDISGDLVVDGDGSIGGNLVVTGDVTARKVITSVTQSSVLYESGSTKFGDTFDDTHEFTGSIKLTGSLNMLGDEVTIDGTFRHTGSLIHSGTLDINSSGSINFSGSNTHIGRFEITGSLNHSGSISIDSTGNVTTRGNADHTGPYFHAGTLHHTGNHRVTGSLNNSGSNTTTGTVEAQEGFFGSFFANPQTITKIVEIPTNYNSRLFGPITIDVGASVTVGANSKLEIIDI